MKYRKVTLNNWFDDSFHCKSEVLEFDEVEAIWKNPDQFNGALVSRRIEYNEINQI